MNTNVSAVPASGPKRFFFLIRHQLLRLIELNLLFLLFSLPVWTLPASFRAMVQVLKRLFHSGSCYLWEDFFAAFRKRFIKVTLTGWFLLLIPFSVIGWLFILGSSSAAVGAGIVLIPAGGALFVYWSFQDAELPLKQVVLSAFKDWRVSMRLLVIPVFLYVVTLYYYLCTIVFIVLLLFSLGALAGYTIYESRSLFHTSRSHPLDE